MGIGRQFVRHSPTPDALTGVYPGGDVQPLLLHLLLFKKNTHMAGGRRYQLLRRAGEPDLPVVDDHDLVTHRLYVLDDVGTEQHQLLLSGAGEEIAEVNAFLRIQAYRGFVENQEGWITQQCLGDAHPLSLAAGEGANFGLGFLLQIYRCDDFLNGVFGVPNTFQSSHIVQKLGDSQFVEEAEVLRQIAEAGLQLSLNLVQRRSVY